MKRSWTDLLAFLITSFAAAPGVTVGPECPLATLLGRDGRMTGRGQVTAAPAERASAGPRA